MARDNIEKCVADLIDAIHREEASKDWKEGASLKLAQ